MSSTSKQDYYAILGLTREASPDDIRKAYRQAALKYHPDRNPDDPRAAEHFKSATEAYSVLSDPQKRARYDQFGHAGLEGMGDLGGMGDIFSQFQDLFSEFFGGFGGRTRRGPARGGDLRVQQRLTLRDSVLGCKREVSIRAPFACEPCGGSGARAGSSRTTCGTCNGSGQFSTARGFVMFTQTCPHCGGEGTILKDPCTTCRGTGAVERTRKVVVAFPAGIGAGQRLRVPGQGLPGDPGAPPGDLYVDVDVAPDDRFERHGHDLATRVTVPFVEAALGTSAEIKLLDDSVTTVEIAAGTQPGSVITVKGKGVPRVDGRGRGNLQVVVEVEVPRSLSPRARELLRDLQRELSPGKKEKGARTA